MTTKNPRPLDTLLRMLNDVERFNRQIIGLSIPDEPGLLGLERHVFRVKHMREELTEINTAYDRKDLAGVADGIVDLVYVALGELIEMGVCPGTVWDEVHEANMRKERGEVSKRPGSLGHDAVKPADWLGPQIEAMLRFTKRDAMSIATHVHGEALPSFDDIPPVSPVLLEVSRLRQKKAADYRSPEDQVTSEQVAEELRSYFPFGMKSYAQMIWTKAKRLVNLVGTDREPNHESVRDTLLDNINYSVFAIEALDAEAKNHGDR